MLAEMKTRRAAPAVRGPPPPSPALPDARSAAAGGHCAVRVPEWGWGAAQRDVCALRAPSPGQLPSFPTWLTSPVFPLLFERGGGKALGYKHPRDTPASRSPIRLPPPVPPRPVHPPPPPRCGLPAVSSRRSAAHGARALRGAASGASAPRVSASPKPGGAAGMGVANVKFTRRARRAKSCRAKVNRRGR